jgi:hypothetical protein
MRRVCVSFSLFVLQSAVPDAHEDAALIDDAVVVAQEVVVEEPAVVRSRGMLVIILTVLIAPDKDPDIVADYAPEVSPAVDDQNNAKKRPSKERMVTKKTNSREDVIAKKSLSQDKLARYSDAVIQIASRFDFMVPSIAIDDDGEVVPQRKSSNVRSRSGSRPSVDVATVFRGQPLRDQISIVHQARKLSMMHNSEIKEEDEDEDEDDEEDEYDINVQDHLSADCPGWKA